jgi:hypothetical protein
MRRITAAMLLPLVVLVGLATAHASFRCARDRVLRSACCCAKLHGHDAARAPAPATPLMKAACCCTILAPAQVEAPAAQVQVPDASSGAAVAAPLLALVSTVAPPAAPAVTRAPLPREPFAPPRTTASLFAQRIALLV